jgi:pimeloyl-ACP methyl ester carboxylesterase
MLRIHRSRYCRTNSHLNRPTIRPSHDAFTEINIRPRRLPDDARGYNLSSRPADVAAYDARPAYTPEEIDRYVEAWSQPGAATGMINYYRSSVRQSPKRAEAALRPIQAPTLVIWGQRDRYLDQELAEPDHDDVPNLDRAERLPDASHWVHHDEAERVTQLLTDFFVPALPAGNR